MLALLLSCSNEPETVENNALQVIDALQDEQFKGKGEGTPITEIEDSFKDVVEPAAEPIYPNLSFIDLSDLHMSYFSEPEIIESLARNLGGHVNEGVDMEVEFLDNSGAIRIFHNKKVSAITSIQPIGQALGSYRHDVASRFDLRVLSFAVELVVGKCRFTTLADAKLTGAYLSPCYTFGRELEPHCGEYTSEGLQFSTSQESQVATCLENP